LWPTKSETVEASMFVAERIHGGVDVLRVAARRVPGVGERRLVVAGSARRADERRIAVGAVSTTPEPGVVHVVADGRLRAEVGARDVQLDVPRELRSDANG
jgi:hypothetical protein